ncbi:MAG: Crp/Fnr family transcriptional regulator [Bacteroidota bacterium]
MQNLIKDIKNNVIISDDNLTKITSKFKECRFEKKSIIPSFGKIAKHFQFIENGLLRVYFLDFEGREITVQIAIKGMWINNLYSFLNQVPSQLHINVLADTTILQISKLELEDLFKEIPKMETFFRLKVQHAYCRLQDRTINQFNLPAKERYLELRGKYGEMESLVPQYVIASYLNITPEHLSKIRKQLAKN